ncbi:TRAP transporter small permease subunit [Leisingera sp. JC11]|uniref:TRAP transporter small permease subunit n=1 Tax=Leisingera sp. JC11 TaxID=3042469 RepID=UPI003453D954
MSKVLSEMFRSWAGYLVTALLFAQIVIVALRYVFALGWPWALDLLVYLFFLSVLLPGLWVLTSNVSVRVDVFYSGFGKTRRRGIDRFSLLFLLFPAMAYSAWASLGTTLNSWRVLESSPTFGGLPGYFLLKTALTLYFTIFAVTALILALRKQPYANEDAS